MSAQQVTFSPADQATVFQSAAEALTRVIAEKPGTDRILAEMVRLCGGALQAGAAGTWVTETPDSPQLILEHNLGPVGLLVNNAPLAGLTVAVRRAARESKPLIVPAFFVESDAGPDVPANPSPYELLFIPMRLHGKVAMVLLIAVAPSNDANRHRLQINFLQKMVAAVEQTLTERHLSLIEKDRGTTTRILKFSEEVHKHLFVGQVAVDIANLVRDAVEADRVTVELYPRRRKKVVAVSNVDVPSKRSIIFQAQRLVLDYVRDRNVPVVLDRQAAKQIVSDPALQDAATAYFAASGFDAFLAAPIKQDEQVRGVILAEYANSPKAQQHSGLLSDLTRVAASSVGNAIEYESIPLRKMLHLLRQLWRQPTSTRRTAILSTVGVALIFLAVIALIPVDFSVKTDCTLRPLAHHSVVAPMEGKIIEIKVRAGQHVYPDPNPQKLPLARLDAAAREKAQLVKPLLTFDSTELVAQKAEQLAKLGELQAQLSNTRDSDKDALAKRAATQKQIESVQSAIALLDQKIAACTVYSPIEGTVLTENIEQKQWSSVKLGEPLLEVARFDDWVLVVDVPETEVAAVRGALERATRKGINDGQEDPGVGVEYILSPWPGQRHETRARGVARLLPSSVQANGKNVFRLEIQIRPEDLPPQIAMSGVTGRAKVHLGRKPLATQWLRGPVRLFKMTIGF